MIQKLNRMPLVVPGKTRFSFPSRPVDFATQETADFFGYRRSRIALGTVSARTSNYAVSGKICQRGKGRRTSARCSQLVWKGQTVVSLMYNVIRCLAAASGISILLMAICCQPANCADSLVPTQCQHRRVPLAASIVRLTESFIPPIELPVIRGFLFPTGLTAEHLSPASTYADSAIVRGTGTGTRSRSALALHATSGIREPFCRGLLPDKQHCDGFSYSEC